MVSWSTVGKTSRRKKTKQNRSRKFPRFSTKSSLSLQNFISRSKELSNKLSYPRRWVLFRHGCSICQSNRSEIYSASGSSISSHSIFELVMKKTSKFIKSGDNHSIDHRWGTIPALYGYILYNTHIILHARILKSCAANADQARSCCLLEDRGVSQ